MAILKSLNTRYLFVKVFLHSGHGARVLVPRVSIRQCLGGRTRNLYRFQVRSIK